MLKMVIARGKLGSVGVIIRPKIYGNRVGLCKSRFRARFGDNKRGDRGWAHSFDRGLIRNRGRVLSRRSGV